MTSFGSRPASGRESSLSVDGQTLHATSPFQQTKKSYKYRRVGSTGSVDETLFTSQRDQYLKSLNSSPNARPTTGSSSEWRVHGVQESPVDKPKRASSGTPSIKSPLMSVSGAPRTRSRLYKSTPSYVDESLFGPELHEPSFSAPWEKSENKRKGPMLTWSPPVAGSLSCTPSSTPSGRTPSAAGAGSQPGSAKGSRPGSANRKGRRPATPNKAVWK